MPLRPTELQIILSATRDIEKVQQLSQQQPRFQQEQLAVQFQHEMEQRKAQAQSLQKSGENSVVRISLEEQERRNRRRKRDSDTQRDDESPDGGKHDHIVDLLI